MAQDVKQRLYKTTQPSGAISFEVMLDYNKPKGGGYTEATVQEAQDYLQQLKGMGTYVPGRARETGIWFDPQEQASEIQKNLDLLSKDSGYAIHPQTGLPAQESDIAKYQENQAKLASGQYDNWGTPEAPLLVPKGTPTPEESNKAFQATQPKPTYQSTAQTQQPMSFQQIQQGILQAAQAGADLAGQQGLTTLPASFQQQFPDISKKFEEGFNKAKETGITAPTDATGANEMFNDFLGDEIGNSAIQDFVSQDPYLNATMTAYQQYFDNSNQRLSLVETYKQMLEESGIEQMDTDLLNMKNIIEGTEDDIRTEVTKAGGFATDSQVIALSNARNKQLIKNYNTLLETRASKEQYLSTMMDLTKEDRQEAAQLFETQMDFGMKMFEISQTMKRDAIESIDRVAKTLGWDGIYQATQGDPYTIRNIESTYGLPAGSLAIAAQRDREIRAAEEQQRLLDAQYKQSQIDKAQFGMELDLAKFEQDQIQFGLDYALEQQKLAAAQAGGGQLTSKQISQALQMSNSLKSHPAYTDMLDIQTGLQGVITGLSAQNGFGDITAINAFQRMVDPGATVRSEDVVLLQTGSGLVDKILSDYPIEKLREGDKLPQAVRDRMKQVALELYERRSGNYNQSVGNQYKQLAAAAQLPFELIGQDFISAENLGLGISTENQVSDEDATKILNQISNNQQTQTSPSTLDVLSAANKGTGGIDVIGALKGVWNWLTK